MKYDKQQKKMTYEMKSVGDAWMDHVEKHHNASAATPSYLAYQDQQKSSENVDKSQSKKMPDLYYEAMKNKDCKKDVKEFEKEIGLDREK
jgi:hypothetical protein